MPKAVHPPRTYPVTANRQHEHKVPAAFSHGDQGLAHVRRVQAQLAGHVLPAGEFLAGVAVGLIGDFQLVQQPQGVCLFTLFGHYRCVSPLSSSSVMVTSSSSPSPMPFTGGRYKVTVTWSPGL